MFILAVCPILFNPEKYSVAEDVQSGLVKVCLMVERNCIGNFSVMLETRNESAQGHLIFVVWHRCGTVLLAYMGELWVPVTIKIRFSNACICVFACRCVCACLSVLSVECCSCALTCLLLTYIACSWC